MDSKKIRKSIGRFLGWLGLHFCSLIIKALPYKSRYALARGLGKLGYLLARKQRRIAFESLQIAFDKEKSFSEVRQITEDCFITMAKSAIEVISLMDRPQIIKNIVKISGEENLNNVLARGKGAILVSGHFGNFPLMLMGLASFGYKTAGIMRLMRDERAEKFFLKKRIKFGIKTIYSQPRKQCVENSIRALRDNELLFIPLDQNFGTAGVFVDFFGHKAATATGPVVLAQRTQAAILPCFIVRQPDDTHEIVFEPPVELKQGNSPQETILINVQELTGIIENFIRKYPAQWGWIHRRWKSRPN